MLVQKLRLQRGWSQQQLAEFAGLSTRTVQRIENGQAASPETLKSLAAVFEVDFARLLADSPAPDATIHDNAAPSASPERIPDMNSAATLSDREEREALRHVRALRRLYGHAARFGVVIVILAIINALQGPGAPWWVLWVILGWGIGLTFHAVRVLGRGHFLGPQWEKRQVERRLGRSLDASPPR
ncbi:2TM domain-containing protein [Amphibiibacter pelophylacis]|uniref:Helix-turn-helix domain-containing protein n=1 Tax=Amphibiibacter pelophylacis TaxID=1799477 RepID=A0ACC6NYF8_9BURK